MDLNKTLIAKISQNIHKSIQSETLLPIQTNNQFINSKILPFKFYAKINQNLNQFKKYKKSLKETSKNHKSPFLPPFEDYLLISNDFGGPYRLILNKFPVLDNHLLLTSKEFRLQGTDLTLLDIINSLELIKQTNSIVFYNAGYNSGQSINHFHLQSVPRESFPFLSSVLFDFVDETTNLPFVFYFTRMKNKFSTTHKISCVAEFVESFYRKTLKDLREKLFFIASNDKVVVWP